MDSPTFNTVASFSSRGPALGTAAIKPEITAVGTNLFLAAQNYDPGGELYSPLRFTVSNGTSFSSPMVAGRGRAGEAAQSSAMAAVADQVRSGEYRDAGRHRQRAARQRAAVGAGKLNVGNAIAANVTVNPATASFGVVQNPAHDPAVPGTE